MKNILTIAVVTPTFYYFGWYIYGCFEPGLPDDRPRLARRHAGPPSSRASAGQTAPWADEMGPNLQNHLNAVFFLAFLLFSWTTGVDHVRRAHRARAPLRLPHPHGHPRLVRVDHGRGLGLERRRLAHDPVRLPRRDRVRASCTASPACSRSACSSTSGRASGSTRRTGSRGASEGTTRI